MANYISALNGEQMDAALTDVALHNSEAWAVGTRNTIPVSSSDETYHNNAKYYAQVAQSAIPGTYTAAVRWDIAQGLAGEAQEQARANISAGASNRNLLDNPWWGSGEVVNQRGVSAFTTGAYNIDRWYFYKSATASAAALSADGVAFTYASGDMQLTQSIPASVYDYIAGKTVTLSILLSDGTIVSGTGTASGSALVTLIPRSTNFMGMIQGSNRTVYIRAYRNATIRAVKLELGSYSTLANDVPPDYGEELRKCKYYFERVKTAGNTLALGIGYNDGYNTMYGVMKIEPKMVTPSLSGSSLLIGTTSLNTTSSSKSIYSFGSDGTAVIQIVATNAFSTNQPYRFGLPANGYIDFSADL